jgi:hypothetical protein
VKEEPLESSACRETIAQLLVNPLQSEAVDESMSAEELVLGGGDVWNAVELPFGRYTSFVVAGSVDKCGRSCIFALSATLSVSLSLLVQEEVVWRV